MKIKFLLPLLLLSSLALGGCNTSKGGKTEGSTSGTDEGPETTETEPVTEESSGESSGSEDELNPYKDFPELDGTSSAFPMDEVNEFLAYFNMEVTLPAPEGTNWGYEQAEYNGDANFFAFCADEGTPGTDAIEDSYKATLEAAGFVIDDSDYDYTGYIVVLEEYPEFKLIFYSYDGDFVFDLYGPFVGLNTRGFPVDNALEFIASYGFELTASDLVVPEDNAIWSSYVYLSYFGEFFVAFREGTADEINAFKDSFPDTWTIDDYSESEDEPYYDIYREIATDVELDIAAYLENGLFNISIGIYDYSEE